MNIFQIYTKLQSQYLRDRKTARAQRIKPIHLILKVLEDRTVLSPSVGISEYTLPSNLPHDIGPPSPYGIIAADDGTLLVTDSLNPYIYRVSTTTGYVTSYYTYDPNSGANRFVRDSDGNFWFPEAGVGVPGMIGEFVTSSDTINQYFMNLSVGAQPNSLAVGSDGTIWFGDTTVYPGGAEIGNITLSGHIQEYTSSTFPSLSQISDTSNMTIGPDNNLWFRGGNNSLLTLTFSPSPNVSKPYPIGTEAARIVTGPDYSFWFNQPSGSVTNFTQIGSIPIPTNGQSYTSYSLQSLGNIGVPNTYGMTEGPDGNLWFMADNCLGLLDVVSQSFSAWDYPISGSPGYSFGLTTGPDGNLWFTEESAGEVCEATLLSLSGSNTGYTVTGQQITPNNLATISTFDPNTTTNDLQVSINWGDGTPATSGSINSGGTGSFSVSGTHTYSAVGTYPVSVQVSYTNQPPTNQPPYVPEESVAAVTYYEVVGEASTSVSLSSSVNPSIFQQPVTFTASVAASAPSTGLPTGTVSFYDGDGTAPLQQMVPLLNGIATYTTNTLEVGTHAITAVYSGDGNFLSSTSPAVDQVVNPTPLVPSVQSVVINPGEGAPGSNTYLGNSRVLSIQVTFNTTVNTTALQSAFTLTRVGLPNGQPGDNATIGDISVATTTDGNGDTIATLTFFGTNTEAGSLDDGIWTLNVAAADVYNNVSPMAANYSQTGIKRLFGDIDASEIVDSSDLGIFGTTFGLTSSNPEFIEGFDYDGNGIVDSVDLSAFGIRFGQSI